MKRENVDRLTSRSLSEAVRERLMRSIAKGELQPGERINEVHLAEACGISRGPIREAARELEGQGFLVSRPNQGFYVKTFTPAQIRDIYEAKDWLEAGFIAEIAAHVAISEREAILAEIDDIDQADIIAFNETLFAFRLGALRRLQNRFLADLMETLYRKFHIVAALVKATDEREQMARILLTLREFWTAMAAEDMSRGRKILLEDTAHWLADLPPRSSPETEPDFLTDPRNKTPMNAPFKNSIAAMLPELTEWRRDFHRHPELMYELPRTARIVAERLRDFGFDEVIEGVGGTGVLGILHGDSGPATSAEKRVLLRADMDALPIAEASGAEHSSTVPGKMHACGHDGHTTILLGAARHLCQTRAFDGTLVFCFQPAEEGGAGAQAMIDDGMLERFPVKGAYGLHNWPGMTIGEFGVARGAAMASSTSMYIHVQGRGGHGAMPHKTRDPIVAASHIVTAAQTIVSRVVDPLEPAVVSITSIHAGEAFNVIPDSVEMRVNFRCFSEATAEILEEELRRICRHTGEAFGVTATLRPSGSTPYPPTVNHHDETELALGAMRAVAGEDKVRDDIKPVPGSEDFAFILRKVPGAYIFMGNGDSAPVHHPAYDFNDAAIPHGVAYFVELAARALPL